MLFARGIYWINQSLGQFLEYLAFAIYFVCALMVTLAEGFWLARKNWGSQAKTMTFAFLTNIVGAAVGGFFMGIAFLIALMMAFEPPLKGSKGQDYLTGGVLLAGAVFGPLILMLTKRLFLLIFGMQKGRRAWVFSLVSAVGVIVAIIIPTVFAYGLTYVKF